MNIIVCMKQVPDSEAPRDCFVINHETNRVEPRGISPLLSLFDENALEAGLRIKDKDNQNVKITVLCMGKKVSDAVVMKALASGADEVLKVEDDLLDQANLDSYMTSVALASAIKKIEKFDLVLVGRQSADWNWGQVGNGLAGLLGIPLITLARKIEISGDGLLVERVLPNGYEVMKGKMPAVVMVSNEIGELRYPTMIQRRDAKKKPIVKWGIDDFDFPRTTARKVVLRRLFELEMRQGQCEMIGGSSPAEIAKNLAGTLSSMKII